MYPKESLEVPKERERGACEMGMLGLDAAGPVQGHEATSCPRGARIAFGELGNIHLPQKVVIQLYSTVVVLYAYMIHSQRSKQCRPTTV